MLRRILFINQSKKQLYVAVVGALLGFTFLITSIHYLIRVNDFGKGEEILGTNKIIVQKKVTNFNALKIAKTDFDQFEIDNLSNISYVEQVEPVLSNSFGVSFQTDSDLVPYFRTDVFVQSVNSDLLKVDEKNWSWSEENDFVPIILPREFLVMLNTFASAKGIPQVSEDLAKSIGFKFKLYNDEHQEYRKAKIIGFTSEISSILIPKSFMDYGNSQFATSNPAKITQLIISIKEGHFGTFKQLMDERSLESNESSMVVGKLKSIAGTLFAVVMSISFVTLFLASLVLIQYAQLIISKNDYEIRTLLRIGYSPNQIIRTITSYFIQVFAIITIISCLLFFGFKMFINQILEKGGIMINHSLTFQSFIALISAFVIYSLVNFLNAKKEILKSK